MEVAGVDICVSVCSRIKNPKAVISLARKQIRKYAEEHLGTFFLRWCLLCICGLHQVFVATQTTGAQILTLRPPARP